MIVSDTLVRLSYNPLLVSIGKNRDWVKRRYYAVRLVMKLLYQGTQMRKNVPFNIHAERLTNTEIHARV